MILPEVLGKYLVHQVVGTILVHLDFFKDYSTFTNDVLGSKDRIQHQVAEDIHGDRQVLIEDFYVEADTFFGGKGVHVAAYGIHLTRDVLRRAARGALKQHVLHKVGDAVSLSFFVARSGLNPYPNGSGTNLLHFLGEDGEAIRQHLTTNIS